MASNSISGKIPALDMAALTPEIKIEGDWVEVTRLLGSIESIIQTSYDKAVNVYSKEVLRIVKKAISTGTPPKGSGIHWALHSPNTIKRYGAHKLLNLKGNYLASIGIQKYKSRTYIGVPMNVRLMVKGKKKKITMNQLAIILEFGTNDGRIPGRPLWKPTLKASGGIKAMDKLIKDNIKAAVRRQLGNKANKLRW